MGYSEFLAEFQQNLIPSYFSPIHQNGEADSIGEGRLEREEREEGEEREGRDGREGDVEASINSPTSGIVPAIEKYI